MILALAVAIVAQLATAQNLRVLEPTPCVTNCTVEANKPVTIAIDAIPGLTCEFCAYQLLIDDGGYQTVRAASAVNGVVRFAVHGFPPGQHVLKVSAFDHTPGNVPPGTDAPSSWSAPLTLRATPSSTPPPPLPPPVIVPTGPPVTLAWDATTEPDVIGYRIEYGTASGVYGTTVPIGLVTQTTVTVPSPTTTYYFAIRATNAAGQVSPLSNEVVFVPDPPVAPCTANPSEPVGSTAVTIVVKYDLTTRRSDPDGADIRVDASSDSAVKWVEIDLEGDGEPGLRKMGPVIFGEPDWRYDRRHGPKFTVNGTWPLTVKAWNSRGEMGSITCRPGITVKL